MSKEKIPSRFVIDDEEDGEAVVSGADDKEPTYGDLLGRPQGETLTLISPDGQPVLKENPDGSIERVRASIQPKGGDEKIDPNLGFVDKARSKAAKKEPWLVNEEDVRNGKKEVRVRPLGKDRRGRRHVKPQNRRRGG